MPKSKKIRLIFFIYWFLLVYILAALIWWYIELSRKNKQMSDLKIQELVQSDPAYQEKSGRIRYEMQRKSAQYDGEGAIFFLLIIAGAVFVYRMVNRELKLVRQQQNFMMAVTHELKTPIAVAKLNLETMQLRKLDESQQQRLLLNTLEETNRLNSLCNNLLLSSQIEAGGYRITNEEILINKVLENCIADLARRFPQREINFHTMDDVIVRGDMFLLQMAVNNLLDNAVKYSPKNSPVTMEMKTFTDRVRIMVTDSGKGIREEEKKRIFDKFHRLGNDLTHVKGTGLGLYLVKKIIDAHKGNVSIGDNSPSGSIFTIELNRLS